MANYCGKLKFIFQIFLGERDTQDSQGGMKTTQVEMGDDTGVFAVVKRWNGKRKIGFPATLNLYIWRLGSFERGNLPGRF
jgi:hypothetical protein